MLSTHGHKTSENTCVFIRAMLVCLMAVFGIVLHPKDAFALDVDLELVLAVDVSSSVDQVEAQLQKNGYLHALVHPYVIDAITTGSKGRIAILYIEYAGKEFQRVVAGWAIIKDLKSARSFIDTLSRNPVSSAPSTSISAAIDFSVHQIKNNAHSARRAVIDISGDGPNSDGRNVWDARDDAIARGITINGLPILSSRPDPQGFSPSQGVTNHYRRFVIGGPGSFLMEVNEFENFAPTLVKKLIREIRDTTQQLSMKQ